MSGIFTADGTEYQRKRVADLRKSASSAPFSYHTNSTKEELALSTSKHFWISTELYPKRTLPYMMVENME